jgi:hypothetical protein
MNAAFERLGVTATPFALYRWALPEDVNPLREAARRMAAGECEVVLFTSSIQLEHLLEIARGDGRETEVLEALRNVDHGRLRGPGDDGDVGGSWNFSRRDAAAPEDVGPCEGRGRPGG